MKKEFDLLREVSRFGVNQGLSLNDPKMSSAFGLHANESLKYALSNPALLHGLRVEAMFENMVKSFGEVVMIKPEDTGPLRTDLPMQAPDFRIVLKDGSNWLAEVKSVYEKNAFRQHRQILNRNYRRSLSNYARVTGGTLKLAVFWARWSIWTLVDPERLAPGDQKLTLDMETAMKANELAVVGDQHLGLPSPIVLRLTMDPARTSDLDEAGKALVTIGKAQLFCGGEEILHSQDQQIAWTVMNYSDWETSDARTIIERNRLLAIEFESNPLEPSHQGFEMAGSLSRIFARHYAQQTISEGIVTNFNTSTQAEWFAALRSDEGLGRMPLWRFIMQPNYDNLPP